MDLQQKRLLTFFYTDTDNKCIFSPCGAEDFWPFWFWGVFEQTRVKRKEDEGPDFLSRFTLNVFISPDSVMEIETPRRAPAGEEFK